MRSKLSWIFFVPFALIGCFLKLAQGFLPEGMLFGFSDLMLEYGYLAAVALIFLLSLPFCLSDKKISKYYLPHRNVPAGIIGMILAVVCAADGANIMFHVISSGQIEVLRLIEVVLLLLSAVVFVTYGLNHSFRNRESKQFTLFLAIPALLFSIRMILCFVSFTTISIRLADVASLICYVFTTLFFFNYAIVMSRIKAKNAVRNCILYGLPAVAATIPCGIYKLLFQFDYEYVLNNISSLELILLGCYILAFLIELTAFVKKADDVVVVTEDDLIQPVPTEEQVDGFLVNADVEDEKDVEADPTYRNTSDTEGYLYQEEIAPGDDPQLNEAAVKDAESFLTEMQDPAELDDEDDRPKDYESRLDDIDKLILEISEQSD